MQKQRDGDYKPEKKEMRHVQEVLQLLSVMTGDRRFEEACSGGQEGGPKNMCEVLEKVEKKGLTEGELLKAQEVAANLKKMGMSEDVIAKAVNMPIELVRQWLDEGNG